MYHCVFLIPALLSCCTGESLVHGPSTNILAFEGGDVILPCSFNITASSDFPTVEWSKEGLEPNVVFLYRDGCETYEMKHQDFEFRTSLIPKELKHGNISLRISNVRLSDAGRYQCMTLWRNDPRSVTAVELVVGSAFEPELSVVSVDCGGVTLQCEANYSQPELEVTFLDDEGNELPAEEPRRGRDDYGSYGVRRRMTLRSPANRVTCRVHQPKFNLVRYAEIHVPGFHVFPAGFLRSCFLALIVAAAGTIFISTLVCVVACCAWRKCYKPVTTKDSDLSSVSTIESQVLLETDSTGNPSTNQLQRKADHLQLQPNGQMEANGNLKDTATASLIWQQETPATVRIYISPQTSQNS